MNELKLCPLCEKKAQIELCAFGYRWTHKCIDTINIFSNNYCHYKEGAVNDWNKYISKLEDFQKKSWRIAYDYAYKHGYEDGWKAND